MSFHDVSLPDGFQYSSQYGAGFSTVTQQTASGHELRVARQAQARHRFRLRKALQNQAEAAALKVFGLARRGSLHSFRLKDWSDYTTNEDGTGAVTDLDMALGTADGIETQFQLVKHYAESAPGEYARTITLPVAGTVVVAVATVSKTLGVDYTLSNPGGIITFGAAPAAGTVTAGFQFDVPARFESGVDEWNALRSDAFEVWTLADLGCIEVLDEVEYPELWYPGGFTDHEAIASDVTISLAGGSLHVFQPDAGTHNVFLPPMPLLFPGGDQVFTISVNGGAGSIQIRDDAGNAVGSSFGTPNTKQLAASVASGLITWHLID